MKRKRIAQTFADHEWAIKKWGREMVINFDDLLSRIRATDNWVAEQQEDLDDLRARVAELESKLMHALEHAE